MTVAHINRIGTAVPAHDIHAPFVAFARTLLADDKARAVFDRMAERAGIAHRYSFLRAGNLAAGEVDAEGFYRRGRFPGTAVRMRRYEGQARALARRAVEALGLHEGRGADAGQVRGGRPGDALGDGPHDGPGDGLGGITHLVVASCTGFTAPGLDLQLVDDLRLRRDVERTMIGFMGCAAAVPALRAAHHIVRSDPAARVLVVNVELSTLHLDETDDLEQVLSFLLFGDGASAALVSAQPRGIALDDFRAVVLPDSQELITWHIGDHGFLMHLSGRVPGRIAQALRADLAQPDAAGILRGEGPAAIAHWAVHAGGRTVLDAVEQGLALDPAALATSRAVLSDYGNMSSATVMFVLQRILQGATDPARGLAMAFGPGMVAETFRFRTLGRPR
jgi:predicted naringenin-chalcone synthase